MFPGVCKAIFSRFAPAPTGASTTRVALGFTSSVRFPARTPLLLLLVVALAVGFVAWRQRHAVFLRQSVAVKGGELTLESVQGGAMHVNPFGPPWHPWVARLPDSWLRRLKVVPSTSLGASGTNRILSCWIAYPSNFTVGPRGGTGPGLGVWILDDLGNESEAFHGTLPMGGTRDGRAWEVHRVDIVPRRSEWLRVRVDDSPWFGKKVAEFRVRNPLIDTTTPAFQGKPLPLTGSDGDLEARLERFVVLTNAVGRPSQRGSAARLEFALRQQGAPTTNWVAYHVASVEDATGNRGDGNSWQHGWEGGRAFVEFAQTPLPHVEPWKVRVEFCQRTGFPDSALWRLRGIPVASSSVGHPRQTNQLHGVPIRFLGVWSDRRDPGPTDPVDVRLKVASGRPPDSRRWHLTLARAVDNLGKDVTANSWSGADDEREFQLKLSPGATSLDVDIAYEPSRMIDFVARPSTGPRE